MSETIKAEYNGYTGYAYGVSSFSVRDKDDREIFHTGFCNKRPQTEAECLEYLKETLDLLSAYVNGTRKPSADHIVDICRPLNCEEMTRKEAIEVLKDIVSKPMLYSNHIIGACRVALASLETDEAYQLEYEQPEFCANCIDRKALLAELDKRMKNFKGFVGSCNGIISGIYQFVQGMPSVLPKAEWIPVSERLPDTDDEVLCWYEYYHWSQEKILPEYGIGCYLRETSAWFGEVDIGKDVRVIAWMPLPKPYEPQESEG